MRLWSSVAWVGAAAACLIACIPEEAPPVKPPEAAAATGVTGGTGAVPDSKTLLATIESMKSQLKGRPRDFRINVALGNLYYDNGKYIDAIEYYTDALDSSVALEKRVTAAVLTHEHAVEIPASCKLEPLPLDAEPGEDARQLDRVVSSADALPPQEANACIRQLAPVLANVHARRGNCWYLIGNAEKARTDHDAALGLDPVNPEALFFSGALILEGAHGDPKQLAAGKALWEKLLQVAPDHPRAQLVRETIPRINELFGVQATGMDGHPPIAGNDAAPMASAPQLPAGMMEAMQNTKHTPEMDAQLDKTTEAGEALLKQGKWEDAVAQFRQVMPLRPDGRIALDLGIAERELHRPMAERVLINATQMPGGDPPRAKYELAVYYEENQNPRQARALYSELLNDPKMGADAKARLARLP